MDERESTPEDIRQLKHQNNERLRNAFEEIINKYSHDFSNVGDEIDITTGEIIVNNGHISRMRDEQDTGLRAESVFFQDWADEVREGLCADIIPKEHVPRALVSEDGWEDVEDEDDEVPLQQKPTAEHVQNLQTLLVDELAGEEMMLDEVSTANIGLSMH
jgi:hypothetical protein